MPVNSWFAVLAVGLLLASLLIAGCGAPSRQDTQALPTVTRQAPSPTAGPPRQPPQTLPTLAPPVQTRPAGPIRGSGCHPAYPTVCIPAPPPDLDCEDIPYRNFPVDRRFGDHHRFDADRDGIGCEGR